MLVGVYDCRGDDVSGRAEFRRLRALAGDARIVVDGPLAVAAWPESPASPVSAADAGPITCVMDGNLHQPATPGARPAVAPDEGGGVLARAYGVEGVGALPRLRGRFSAVLWNREAKRGLATCDLLATRQLFIDSSSGALVFAAEIPELLALTARRPGPDPVAFAGWLATGHCPEGATLYEGVTRLGPGEAMELAPGTPRTRVYWKPTFAGTLEAPRADCVEGLRVQLRHSIGSRLSSTANAVILSGGVDSSIVTAVAERVRPPATTLRTYSGVFPGREFDESEKIRLVTTSLGVSATTLQIEPRGTLWLALEWVRRWQQPLIAAGALIDTMATVEAGRDGARAILDGQTGDEVFGFTPYLVADMMRRGRLRSAIRLAGEWPMGRRATARNKRWILRELGLKGAAPYRVGQFIRSRREPSEADKAWLLPGPRRTAAGLEDRWAWKERLPGPLWWRHQAETLVYAPHRELRLDYLRHRAAAHGLVNESVLYDVDLMEYCLRLPPELMFDWRFDRALAREAMRGWLPEEVRLQSQKADFSPFCNDAMVGADRPGIDRLLTAADAEIGAYVDMTWVRDRWSRLQSGEDDPMAIGTIWRIVAAECWLRSQADAGFADAMLGAGDVVSPSVASVAPV